VAQFERSNQAPLPLPLEASASDGLAQVIGRLLDLCTSQEEDVIGTLERAGSLHAFAQAQDCPP
jgi:hypothetical protein